MMKPILTVLEMLVFLPLAYPQDVPPPPKPSDDGPSLEATMTFIQEKLGSIGRLNFINYTHDNSSGRDWTNKLSNEVTGVRASVAACRIDYHERGTRNDEVDHDKDYWFLLKYVQDIAVTTKEQEIKEIVAKAGHPEQTSRTEPPVFVIQAKQKVGTVDFHLYDESLANRIAKALQHAVELCGGGSKDPF